MAVLALDCSSAFDLLDHDLIIKSLEIIGAGKKMVQWSKSFLEGCEYSIRIEDHISSSWSSEWGAGQGRRFSPPFFNIGSLSMPLWTDIVKNILFADETIAAGLYMVTPKKKLIRR